MKHILEFVEYIKEGFSEKLIQQLINKFKEEKPSLTDAIIFFYINLKNSPKIEDKNILNYTWDKLEQVVDVNQPKKIKTTNVDDIKVSNSDLIYNQNNLKIYEGRTLESCVKYGNGYSFCISARGEGNMYNSYRYGEGKSPYFVIDEDRTKEKDKFDDKFVDPYHLIVIMFKLNNPYDYPTRLKWYVTTANNDGEEAYTWDEIVKKQPKLKGLGNLFREFEPIPKEKELHELQLKYDSELKEVNNDFANQNRSIWESIPYKIMYFSDIYINQIYKLIEGKGNMYLYTGYEVYEGEKGDEMVSQIRFDEKMSEGEFAEEYYRNDIYHTEVVVEINKLPVTENQIKYLEIIKDLYLKYLKEKNNINLKYHQHQ